MVFSLSLFLVLIFFIIITGIQTIRLWGSRQALNRCSAELKGNREYSEYVLSRFHEKEREFDDLVERIKNLSENLNA